MVWFPLRNQMEVLPKGLGMIHMFVLRKILFYLKLHILFEYYPGFDLDLKIYNHHSTII